MDTEKITGQYWLKEIIYPNSCQQCAYHFLYFKTSASKHQKELPYLQHWQTRDCRAVGQGGGGGGDGGAYAPPTFLKL